MQILGIFRLTGSKVGPCPSGFEVLGYHHALRTDSQREGKGPGVLARSSFFRSRRGCHSAHHSLLELDERCEVSIASTFMGLTGIATLPYSGRLPSIRSVCRCIADHSSIACSCHFTGCKPVFTQVSAGSFHCDDENIGPVRSPGVHLEHTMIDQSALSMLQENSG